MFVLLAIAFALKSAYFPFHTWLPRAHAAAPAHVSALMSGVIHKAGLFGLLRFTLLMGKPEEWMGWAVLAMGAASALFGALSTASQRDLKRLLGYSSTENVGIAAIGFGVGYLGLAWDAPALVLAGFGGGLFHLLNHALFKCLLFYAAGAVFRVTHTVDLERLGGLCASMPATGGVLPAGRAGDLGAAAAQRLRERVPHLRRPARRRRADRAGQRRAGRRWPRSWRSSARSARWR